MGVTFTDVDDEEDFGETHEINVTPFIDVVLVLLIIFMVAAPLSTVDLPVDLPTSSAVPHTKPDKPTYVSIKADLAVAIGETPVKRVDLVRTLDNDDPNKDRRIFLRADRAVPYGDMMDVLELLRTRWLHQGGACRLGRPSSCARSDWDAGTDGKALRGHRKMYPTDQALRRNVWIFAAIFVCCAHVALAAFAIARMNEPEDDDLGAPGIEIAFELTSAQTTPSELPPGPESEASAASPPVVEQKTAEKKVDLPKETPVESENPDRLVTIEKTDKPEEKEPEPTIKMMKASEEFAAQEATAAPTIQNVQQAAKSTTMDQGTGQSQQRARVTWQKELMAHLDKFKRYPTERSQKGAEILIAMTLDRTGRILSANIAKSSGDDAFDHAAIVMVERASPVPPPPPLVADEGLDFSLPVIFKKNSN